ncbi:MAG: TonB-dependent receptor plug domain-containing protein [Sphingobacterium mizutaii]|nr:TonB-dependent receptor plug domain-containing protein [Sphingobacterium mizutaii]
MFSLLFSINDLHGQKTKIREAILHTVTQGPIGTVKEQVVGTNNKNRSSINVPLIIVSSFPNNSIDEINPNDAESISVLRDASSAANYGSREAAGVISLNNIIKNRINLVLK